MNKSEFIKIVASNLTKLDKDNQDKILTNSERAVTIFFNKIMEAISNGEKVGIRGLGTFKSKTYREYVGRNPKTGKKVNVPKKKLPVFKASPNLISWLNDALGTPINPKK